MKIVQLNSSTIEQINPSNSLVSGSDELGRKLQEYGVCLKNMALRVRDWIIEIGDFLSYADDRIEMIGGPNNSTKAYVARFHSYIDRIYALYNDVEESMEKSKSTCQSAVLLCCEDTRTRRNTTGVFRGAVAGAFVAAARLLLTTITGGMVTAGTPVVPHLAADLVKSIEDTCKEQWNKFDALREAASEMNLILKELLKEVKYIKNEIEDANSYDHEQLYTSLKPGVKDCLTMFKNHHKELVVCRADP